MPARDHATFASASVPRHLTRGAIGFGLIASALALAPSFGPAALLLAPAGLVALRGCPTCWTIGLIHTISAGRLQRACTDTGCTLQRAGKRTQAGTRSPPGHNVPGERIRTAIARAGRRP